MNGTSRQLLKNFTSLGIIQGTNFLIPLALIPYVIKRIGIDGFGIVSVAQVVMMFLSTIADYGFNLTATRDIATNRGDHNKLSGIFWKVIATKLILCLVLFVMLMICTLFIEYLRLHFLLYILSFVTVIGQSLVVNWLFQGIERMKYITYISLLARVIFVILVLSFIHQKQDLVYFVFFTGIGNLIAGVVGILLAIRLLKISFQLPSAADIRQELKSGWHIMASNFSVSIYMYVNILLLRLFTNDASVGVFSIADKIIQACRQILSVYFQAIYPQVCRLAISSKLQLRSFLLKNFVPFAAMVLAGCIFIYAFSPSLVRFFSHEQVELSVHYLRIMAFVPFIICLNIPAYQVMIANDARRKLLLIFGSGTLLNFALNFFITSRAGADGTSYVILIVELFITVSLISFTTRDTRLDFLKSANY